MDRRVHKRQTVTSSFSPPETQLESRNTGNTKHDFPFTESSMLYWIFGLRLASIWCVQTYFAPDEYWQSLEVAHKLVYGYGYLTWEWQVGLRSYLHPLTIALLYSTLNCIKLDYPYLLVLVPRLVQAFMSSMAEIYFYKFVKRWFGQDIAMWTAVAFCTSWMWFYCATRTLMNTVETGLTCFVLYTYPWDVAETQSELNRKISIFTVIASLAVVLRPTSVSVWAPLYIWLFYKIFKHRCSLTNAVLWTGLVGASVLLVSTIVDRLAYGRWVFVHYNFFHFNVVKGQGVIYGSEPWHWYMTEGVPVICGPHFPFVIHGLYLLLKHKFLPNWTAGQSKQKSIEISKLLCIVCVSTVLMYSLVKHKEHRFLINLLPMLCFLCAISIVSFTKKGKVLALIWLLSTNAMMSVYFGLYHQSSPIKVINFLRKRAEYNLAFATNQNQFALFLLPCHSTPYYSHMHHNVSMRFLTCQPDLEGFGKREYSTEQDLFYDNPEQWLRKNIFNIGQVNSNCNKSWPLHIVMFDELHGKVHDIKPFSQCYSPCFSSFHTHFPEGKASAYMYVYCRNDVGLSEDMNTGIFH